MVTKQFLKLFFFTFFLQLNSLLAQQKFIFQAWYWDYPKTYQGAFWVDTLNLKAGEISKAGFTDIWLPPLSLANTGAYSNGYDIRDLFNLGSPAYKTGFGTRTKVDALVNTFNGKGLRVMSDMIYNHRDGGQLETNEAVGGWIKNYNLMKHNSGDQPYPSDRVLMAIPVGGASGRGEGHYYFKIRSASQSSDYFNKSYTILAYTGKVGKKNLPNRNESAVNGGADCAQPHDTLKIGVSTNATIDNSGCGIDEFELFLDSVDFISTGDHIFISLVNPNGDYADQYIYGLWDAANSLNIKDSVRYQTKTKFNALRGQMSKANFKPNGNPTCLCGDLDAPFFYFDYDQNVPATRDTLFEWTKWMWTTIGARSFRVDAVKHFSTQFVGDMLNYLNTNNLNPPLYVGELFDYNAFALKGWTDNVKSHMNPAALAAIKPAIFDFSLQGALRDACDAFGYDARNVFNSGVVDGAGGSGENAATFVNNHDFRMAAQSVDNDRMLAYAYILTNNKLGTASVYYPDYYDTIAGSLVNKNKIDRLIEINNKYINNSTNRDYLNRFGTGYTSNFISGAAANSLIYQLSGGTNSCAQNKDVLVAINFSGNQLKVDHQVNTGAGYNLSLGDTLIDILGNSSFPYAIVNSNAQIYMQLAPRSYSVWVKGGLTKSPVIAAMSSLTICDGDSVLMQVSNGNNCNSYQWQLNGVDIPNATNGTFYAKSAGNFTLKMGQSGVLEKVSAGLQVSILQTSMPQITVQTDTLIASNALFYQWFYSLDSLNFSPISSANQQSLIVPQSGYFFVQTTDSNTCKANSVSTFVNVTSLSEIVKNFSFGIYPNPSANGIFVFKSTSRLSELDWKIYSILGEIVLQKTNTTEQGLTNQTIDLSNAPSGIYYLQLTSGQLAKTIKLIKL
jgi:hypothetical protein